MKAILLALAGFFCYTLMDLAIKWLLQFYPLIQVIFYNGLFALLSLLLWIIPRPHIIYSRYPALHLKRAFLLLVADVLAFFSYGQLPLAEAYTLILTMPLFVALFAMILRYENFDLIRLGLALLGFCGVTIVLSPSFRVIEVALLAALACAIIEAFSFLIVVKHKHREHPLAFAFYGMALTTVVTGLWPGWSFSDYSISAYVISAGGGFCFALATVCVLFAFQKGSPSSVSSMQYSQMLWGLVLGAMIWGDWPAISSLLGGLVIMLSGLLLIQRERYLAQLKSG